MLNRVVRVRSAAHGEDTFYHPRKTPLSRLIDKRQFPKPAIYQCRCTAPDTRAAPTKKVSQISYSLLIVPHEVTQALAQACLENCKQSMALITCSANTITLVVVQCSHVLTAPDTRAAPTKKVSQIPYSLLKVPHKVTQALAQHVQKTASSLWH